METDNEELAWDDDLDGEYEDDLLDEAPPPVEPMTFADEFDPGKPVPVVLDTPEKPEAFGELGKMNDGSVGY